jgi:hypothetical protein
MFFRTLDEVEYINEGIHSQISDGRDMNCGILTYWICSKFHYK